MKRVKITVMKKTQYEDLIEKYENPIANPCDMETGKVFISENGEKPEGMCSEAFKCMEYFLKKLACGKGNFFGGWMKNEKSAMVSCNDGFRPTTFYLEVID